MVSAIKDWYFSYELWDIFGVEFEDIMSLAENEKITAWLSLSAEPYIPIMAPPLNIRHHFEGDLRHGDDYFRMAGIIGLSGFLKLHSTALYSWNEIIELAEIAESDINLIQLDKETFPLPKDAYPPWHWGPDQDSHMNWRYDGWEYLTPEETQEIATSYRRAFPSKRWSSKQYCINSKDLPIIQEAIKSGEINISNTTYPGIINIWRKRILKKSLNQNHALPPALNIQDYFSNESNNQTTESITVKTYDDPQKPIKKASWRYLFLENWIESLLGEDKIQLNDDYPQKGKILRKIPGTDSYEAINGYGQIDVWKMLNRFTSNSSDALKKEDFPIDASDDVIKKFFGDQDTISFHARKTKRIIEEAKKI